MILLAYILPRAPVSHRQSKYRGRVLGQWCMLAWISSFFRHYMSESKPTVPGLEDGVEYEVQRFKGRFSLKSPSTGIGP